MRWAITINVNLRLNLIQKINISNLHQHIQKQVSLVTTVSRYFCWYAGKSLLGTAAVNVAIICIFNIRRRENSLMKQILGLGEGDFSMAMSKREGRKRNIKNIFSCVTEFDISSRDFSVSRLFSIFWEYRSQSRKFWSGKKVSVSVSKIFGLEKSLGIGLENI